MSKKIDAMINCPHCNHQFRYTLFRSIWGEYPENRELVMSDQINVATCPACKISTKLPFPFLYTNTKQNFAVWWEPEYDPQIDNDCNGYARMMGANSYLAAAPRIKEWNAFKETILKFERGELKGQAGALNKELQNQMNDFINHLQKQSNNTHNNKWAKYIFGALFIGFVLYVLFN